MPSRIASVGVVGAGAATQAIHLPTLARLPDLFRLTAVTDVDGALAAAVAERAGARAVGSLPDMLERDTPDVVVICSPNQFHAEQVIAACQARVAAVLCEKPLATSVTEAEAIARASVEYGVPVFVGTMHGFDPVWTEASRRWAESGAEAHTVRIVAQIPPNPRTEDFATEVTGRPAPATPATPAAGSSADPIAALIAGVRGGVLGLAIHDLPLARRLLPDSAPRVSVVHAPASGGYLILCDVGDALLEVRGGSSRTWLPDWRVEAIADDHALRADFGASYVHAGSAVAELTEPSPRTGFDTTVLGPVPANGYLELWRSIAGVLAGRTAAPDIDDLVADLAFAVGIADGAADLLSYRLDPTRPDAAEVTA